MEERIGYNCLSLFMVYIFVLATRFFKLSVGSNMTLNNFRDLPQGMAVFAILSEVAVPLAKLVLE